jgi:transposase
VRAIDVFVDELDLRGLGFEGVVAETTGRPAYHPATILKIYVYGYVNQIQSSQRLERETARDVEMMWLTGRLTPDFKTIADFRKDNGPAIRSACRQFVALCRSLNLFAHAMVAIDGSRFKAVNSRDRSFSRGSTGFRGGKMSEASPRFFSTEFKVRLLLRLHRRGLSHELGSGRTRSRRARYCSGRGCRPPTLIRFASESAERIAGNEMALDVECVLDCGMDGQEPLISPWAYRHRVRRLSG